uniref:NADH-ubiquinone oxidoreductase chain 2 n=1 Tax=Dictyoptera aurora TaxID=1053893 RepID=A0A0S2MN97_9COLE|nr:NADH deshydrogenase subunit 2 [Dictyoptera aurora]
MNLFSFLMNKKFKILFFSYPYIKILNFNLELLLTKSMNWISNKSSIYNPTDTNKKKTLISTESSIKYFITQVMASSIMILTIVMIMAYKSQMIFMILMNSSLLTKMGMAPFHFWFPEVMEGLSWMNCLIMMTWQKLAPMVLIMYNLATPMFNEIIIVMAMLISSFKSFNQISMRKLLTYSSINHMGWMIASMMINQAIWMIYLLIYSLISAMLIWALNANKIMSLNQMYLIFKNNSHMKLFFSLNFLNMSGLPPFLGFLPKWMTIEAMINNNLILLAMMMVLSTMIMIFIYLKISITSLIMNSSQLTWSLKMNKKKSFYFSLMNFLSLSSIMVSTLIFNLQLTYLENISSI